MNLLNDCNEAECNAIEENPSYPRQRAGKLNTLRNATIQAMSNLLSANIDSGLMHSIGKQLFDTMNLLYYCFNTFYHFKIWVTIEIFKQELHSWKY